jgi:hypothetical protein
MHKAGLLYRYIYPFRYTIYRHTQRRKAFRQVHSALATLSVTARQAMHGGN